MESMKKSMAKLQPYKTTEPESYPCTQVHAPKHIWASLTGELWKSLSQSFFLMEMHPV